MDIVAAILLFGAAFAGLFPLVHVSHRHEAPRNLLLAHVALAVLGWLALLIYAIATNNADKHLDALVLLTIALLIGAWLWSHSRRRRPSPLLVITYVMMGMIGFWWLLTYVIT